MSYKILNRCLACDSDNLTLKLDLTTQALANNYVETPGQQELEFPLAVNLCKNCYHLQLTHAVDPELIYKNYLYVSGTSKTAQEYFSWFARFAHENCRRWPTTVLDIGCNDGTQLNYFKQMGYRTYGIDPAENLYSLSSQNHTIYCDFFNESTANKLVEDGVYPDIVVAQNSFAHNPDPYGYLIALKKIMKPDSLFFIQTSQGEMIQRNEFDTIYHEHVNFYNINSMNELCHRAGLHLVDVVKTPIHGTSYIFIVATQPKSQFRMANHIALEASQGLLSEERYDQWVEKVNKVVGDLVSLLNRSKNQGYRLIGYGAAAKGNTLLNFSKIRLDYIIDDNPNKQGLHTPGMNIPIVGPDILDRLDTNEKIMFVPLAWNFYTEIKSRIQQRRQSPNDKFVRYFPELRTE